MSLKKLKDKIVNEIFPGWTNLVKEVPHLEQMALDRMSICMACDYIKKHPTLKHNYCGKCGCPVAPKSWSQLTSCPMMFWTKMELDGITPIPYTEEEIKTLQEKYGEKK